MKSAGGGWDVLGAIKGDPHTASTPVVVVSVIHERGRGFALGASDYLVKPVARDDLPDGGAHVFADTIRRLRDAGLTTPYDALGDNEVTAGADGVVWLPAYAAWWVVDRG